MAIGAPGSGKSTTIDVIAKLLGSKVEQQATGEAIQSLLRKTTVPLCWDDPPYPSSVKLFLLGPLNQRVNVPKGGEKKYPEQMLCWQSISN